MRGIGKAHVRPGPIVLTYVLIRRKGGNRPGAAAVRRHCQQNWRAVAGIRPVSDSPGLVRSHELHRFDHLPRGEVGANVGPVLTRCAGEEEICCRPRPARRGGQQLHVHNRRAYGIRRCGSRKNWRGRRMLG